tara:strand:+ start:5658 stop:5915 length:258 start_codon:yes stop_codon:yes gene_type:complete
MKLSKKQLKKIIKEEKQKILTESYEYDVDSEIYDVLQHLSDASLRLEEIVQHYDTVDPENRKAMQIFNLANQIKKIEKTLETHVK